jgi:ATP-dependent protease HslVU (ClpYQ) peptidase subunit
MTCIIGYKVNNLVYIGGDSCGADSYSYTKRIRKDSKVFKNGEYIIGYTSSFRMGQLLRFNELPIPKVGEDLYQFFCTKFIDTIREILKKGGYATVKENAEQGGCFLVGYRDRLFEIESDFQVSEVADSFDSIGCGSNFSLGALKILEKESISPIEKISRALEVASYFSAYVTPPFLVMRTGLED